MKTSTTDKVEGNIHKVNGEIKETVGQITNDPHLEAEGTIEKAEGKAQDAVGQIKKVLGK